MHYIPDNSFYLEYKLSVSCKIAMTYFNWKLHNEAHITAILLTKLEPASYKSNNVLFSKYYPWSVRNKTGSIVVNIYLNMVSAAWIASFGFVNLVGAFLHNLCAIHLSKLIMLWEVIADYFTQKLDCLVGDTAESTQRACYTVRVGWMLFSNNVQVRFFTFFSQLQHELVKTLEFERAYTYYLGSRCIQILMETTCTRSEWLIWANSEHPLVLNFEINWLRIGSIECPCVLMLLSVYL